MKTQEWCPTVFEFDDELEPVYAYLSTDVCREVVQDELGLGEVFPQFIQSLHEEIGENPSITMGELISARKREWKGIEFVVWTQQVVGPTGEEVIALFVTLGREHPTAASSAELN
jgi:hypothetical protein